jgi:hypothetical protein
MAKLAEPYGGDTFWKVCSTVALWKIYYKKKNVTSGGATFWKVYSMVALYGIYTGALTLLNLDQGGAFLLMLGELVY